ncbi:Uncharacterized protein PIL02S_00510 [Paenibacillus illinoisensis]|uniref:Uncharacterized protein n=1 Tax=Paenibacillus illinoisensis TaxID=59845 RepID=A0A2W0CDA6_9BACL|nr:Uncharacterized protein PIL02S_00510 [Paenibacillus illinoisensis]
MYILSMIILIITGLVSVIDILFGIKESGEGIRIFVNVSQALFFLSILFFIIKMPTRKK